ncbi:MarR family winged helix-turn-helix transcriptional regulator [Enterovibrio calviensis]|uniref:MarR family winged helix-turn-helix transcriptional regulator n=1 Tax=Enterovibrio calviensis TaxID=91359 RepID=UPI0004846CE7|nr:MarR family transcriptional regulator [Enterovibrio calviensis]
MLEADPFQLDDFLPYKLVKTAAHVADSLAHIYEREFGLSRAQWRILASLGAREGIKAKELAEETSLDKVRVSRTLVEMEQNGWVSKQRDSKDQRAAFLHLTEKGKQLYVEILPKARAWEQELMSGIEWQEYQSFLNTLDALLEKAGGDPRRTIREP